MIERFFAIQVASAARDRSSGQHVPALMKLEGNGENHKSFIWIAAQRSYERAIPDNHGPSTSRIAQ